MRDDRRNRLATAACGVSKAQFDAVWRPTTRGNMTQLDELLLAITRCPELGRARAGFSSSCAKIAGLQPGDDYHVPEPWSGHIDTAPILFVSSNPSISESEHYPTPRWTDARTVDFFQRRFDPDASYSFSAFRRVRFWTSVRRRAEEILEREAIPGEDFALTELVHCKSRGEERVREALPTCTERWLPHLMRHAAANIVILLGSRARDYCTQLWGLERGKSVHFDVPIAGQCRAVVILPHPNAFEKKTLAGNTLPEERQRLRSLL